MGYVNEGRNVPGHLHAVNHRHGVRIGGYLNQKTGRERRLTAERSNLSKTRSDLSSGRTWAVRVAAACASSDEPMEDSREQV